MLLGDPARLDGLTSRQVRRCWELFAKIKLAPLALDWREQLEGVRVTSERLRKYLDAVRLRDQPTAPGGRAA